MKKMTNIKVKEMIREIGDQKPERIEEIKKRKTVYCGHITRKTTYTFTQRAGLLVFPNHCSDITCTL